MHIAFRDRPLAFGTLVATCIGVFVGLVGCAHVQPPAVADAPETVGALAPSYHSVAVAPVHATTDLGNAEMVETGGHGPDAASPSEVVVAPLARGGDPSLPPSAMVVTPAARGVDPSLPPSETDTPDVVAKSAHGY